MPEVVWLDIMFCFHLPPLPLFPFPEPLSPSRYKRETEWERKINLKELNLHSQWGGRGKYNVAVSSHPAPAQWPQRLLISLGCLVGRRPRRWSTARCFWRGALCGQWRSSKMYMDHSQKNEKRKKNGKKTRCQGTSDTDAEQRAYGN